MATLSQQATLTTMRWRATDYPHDMGRLSQFALGITELRDVFGAESELADRLRQIAASEFPAPASRNERRRGKLLRRIGPALKHSIEPPKVPNRPAPPDVEALLEARAILPARRGYAWQVLLAWLGELSWGRMDVDITEREMSTLEFDLAAAGLSAQFSLENLLKGEPQIPLLPLPGQRWGYAKYRQVLATHQALSMVSDALDDRTAAMIQPFFDFLQHYPDWARQAAHQGRPAPDLIVSWMP